MKESCKVTYRVQDPGLGQARRPSMGPMSRIRVQCRSKIGKSRVRRTSTIQDRPRTKYSASITWQGSRVQNWRNPRIEDRSKIEVPSSRAEYRSDPTLYQAPRSGVLQTMSSRSLRPAFLNLGCSMPMGSALMRRSLLILLLPPVGYRPRGGG